MDTNGITQGNVVYDALRQAHLCLRHKCTVPARGRQGRLYGAVLTSTLPATLTAALAGQGATPDPSTGLVYLGAGRWYDPTLGRPLQPNPIGGPPVLPQALNRYAATPWGPPGVAEAQIGYQPGVLERGLFKTGLTYLANQGRQALIIQLTAQRPTGWVNLTVRAARGSVPASLGLTVTGETVEELTLFESYLALHTPAPLLTRLFVAGRVARDLGRRLLGRQTVVQTMEGRVLQSDLESLWPGVEVLASSAESRAMLSATSAFWLKHGLGMGWAIGLNTLVQYWGDVGNPYLTPEQRTWRVVSAGVGGGVAGYLATTLVTAKLGAVLGIEGGPPGMALGAAVGFTLGVIWYGFIQPQVIFPTFGLDSQRNLAPLQPSGG